MSLGRASQRRLSVAVTLGCLALGIGMRALHLRADPPPDLSPSGGYFADEGFWSHNARNKVLFGQWATDDWNDMWAAAPNHWLQYTSFSLLGVGLAQARVAPLVLSAVLLGLCYWIGVRFLRGSAGLLCLVLAGTDFLLVMFNRLALLETPVLLFALAALVCACGAAERGSRGWSVAAGCLLVLAVATKRTAVYLAPALIVLMAISRSRGRVIGWFILGVLAAGLSWLLCVGCHLSEVLTYHRYYASQQVAEDPLLKALVRQPLLSYFRFSVPVLILGLAGAVHVWRRLIAGGSKARPLEVACLVWLASGVLYLGTLGYRPLRYYVLLLIPLVLLAAQRLSALASAEAVAARGHRGARILATWFAGMVLGVLLLGWLSEGSWPGWRRLGGGAILIGLGFTLGAEALDWVGRKAKPYIKRIAAVVLLTLGVLWNAKEYTSWVVRPTYAVHGACLDIADLPEGSVLTGQWALELTLESTHRAIPVWKGFVNDVDPFRRYGITHAAVWDRHMDRFKAWYPEAFRDARVLRTYWVKQSVVYLLELDAHRAPGRLVPTQEE